MIKIAVTQKKVFSLTQDNVLAIVAQYLNDTHGTNLKPEDLVLRIDDSQSGDYHGPHVPAKIREISATVEN